MSCSEAELGNLRRPKSNPISHSDPKPKKTHSIFRISTNNDCSDKSNKSFNKKPNKKIKKLFTSVTLGGLGCGGRSEPESAPAVFRSAAEWEAKKLKMMKKKKMKKKKKKKQMKMASNVCCAPPRIGFAYDVAPIARVDAQIRNHRERSCGAPRRTANAAHVSDDRQFRRFRRSSRGGFPEIMMFQRNLLMFERSLSRNDQFGDWRLNVDTMSYEELLDLSDRMGYVGTGLQEDEIMLCLVKTTSLNSESLPLLTSSGKDWTCSICQGGCKEDEELGRLDCGHYHHINCIKQWLQYKNACPICKTAAVVDKLG